MSAQEASPIRPHEVGFLNMLQEAEKQVMDEMLRAYAQALADIREQLAILKARQDQTTSVFQRIQYKIAQERQLAAALNAFREGEIATIKQYKTWMYTNGFISISQSLNVDGLPLIIPLDPNVMAAALANQVRGLNFADRTGVQMDQFHRDVSRAINAGLARNASFLEIAREITRVAESRFNWAFRIALTEGNRVLNQAKFHAMQEAVARGADIMKQWHSARMPTTRDTHLDMHNQIRELDEPFENKNGATAMHPLGFGIAEEDINCHCTLLQRARWALEDAEVLDDLREVPGMEQLMNTQDPKVYAELYEATADDVVRAQDDILF